MVHDAASGIQELHINHGFHLNGFFQLPWILGLLKTVSIVVFSLLILLFVSVNC